MAEKEVVELKLKQFFAPMLVRKGRTASLLTTVSAPSYVKDWFLMKNCNQDGELDPDFGLEKFYTTIPNKERWKGILDNLMCDKQEKFLAKIKIKVDISKGERYFSLPDLDVDFKDTIIEPYVWEKIKASILGEEETWGVVTLGYGEYGKGFKIKLLGYVQFRPYKIDLSFYKEVAKEFRIEEWIDVLLGAMNYNPEGFKDETEKLAMLKRLLPFVEKRVNLIELAPKGTGKSYVYSQLSKYGWLVSGGVVSRAKLFYDMSRSTTGLVGHYDYVGLDEISTIRFTDLGEVQGALKGYLESGTFAVGVKANSADAGMVFLGNIKADLMNEEVNMFQELPSLFNDSALVDRIHGFIEGWTIPRMDESMKANAWALNSEYFSEILHALRSDIAYSKVVDHFIHPTSGDTRDITAIKRLSTAFLKLLFPYADAPEKIEPALFKKYCFDPAYHMRSIIKKQLGTMDKEYLSKPMPEIVIPGIEE